MPNAYLIPEAAEHRLPVLSFAELMAAVLSKGKPFRFQARGYSMYPFIRSGDILTISPLDRRVRLGQVVACLQPGDRHLVVHRIVRLDGTRYLVRGDYTPMPDGLVTVLNLIGRVTRIEHGGRKHHFGLGWERILIAHFSRIGLLFLSVDLTLRIWAVIRKVVHG
ncbi:MAG: S24/S26 family peptidase [Anaerolineae bacterium]